MAVVPKERVIALCPWIEFHARPFEVCGVRVMGFRDLAALLDDEGCRILSRVAAPYADYFLRNADRTPRPWNQNPLLYVIDPEQPLRLLRREEEQLVALVNSCVYVTAAAANRVEGDQLHFYTNSSDWTLYFHKRTDPDYFALPQRRLLGSALIGGFQWDLSVLSMPVECTKYRLQHQELDRTLLDGVTRLYQRERLFLYQAPLRTFVLGTSDNHLWNRAEDLQFLWGAIEQTIECTGFESCVPAQDAITRSAEALRLPREHSMSLIRAVVGAAPTAEHVWSGDFRPGRRGGASVVTGAQSAGVEFSALERALDELNYARNRMIHDGALPVLEWPALTLAFLGARFWMALFRRILAWEGVRKWTDADDCEVIGLQRLAASRASDFKEDYVAYLAAIRDCLDRRVREQILAEFW